MICATAKAEGLSDLTAWWTHTYSPSVFVSGTKPTAQLININIPLYIQFISILACLSILRICKDMYLSKSVSAGIWRSRGQEKQLVHVYIHTYIHIHTSPSTYMYMYVFMIQCIVGKILYMLHMLKDIYNSVTTWWQQIIYFSITVAQQIGFAWVDFEKVAWLQLQLFPSLFVSQHRPLLSLSTCSRNESPLHILK